METLHVRLEVIGQQSGTTGAANTEETKNFPESRSIDIRMSKLCEICDLLA